jgi:Family of unknown function (DUF6114)
MTASEDGEGPAGPAGPDPVEPPPPQDYAPGLGWPPWELTDRGAPPAASAGPSARSSPGSSAGLAEGTPAAAGPATHRLTAARGGGRRRTLRTWRRSRPFWGGLLLILAGLEMLAIPLLSVLVHSSVKVIIYIGIGGVFGVLIGGLLVACGLLIWFQPNQRVFYAIAGVLLAVVSFVATNLGGFFLGMLLGVTGGSLSFAWAPVTARRGPADGDAQPNDAPAGDVTRGDVTRGDHRGSGGRLTALAATPLILSGLMLPGYLGSAAQPAAGQAGCIIYIPIICPPPSPAPSPSASGTPTAQPTTVQPTTVQPTTGQPATSAVPTLAPTAAGTPEPGASDSPTPSPSASATAQPKAAAPGPLAAAAPSSLTADSALLEGLAYDGVAQVPTANGTVTMMKFTMNSLTLTGDIALTVTEGGGTDVTRSSSMHFGGPVVLYATKLSGDLLGIPVTITPDSPLATVLQLLAPLTQAVPVPMTNVVTDQPYTTAGSLQASGLQLGA